MASTFNDNVACNAAECWSRTGRNQVMVFGFFPTFLAGHRVAVIRQSQLLVYRVRVERERHTWTNTKQQCTTSNLSTFSPEWDYRNREKILPLFASQRTASNHKQGWQDWSERWSVEAAISVGNAPRAIERLAWTQTRKLPNPRRPDMMGSSVAANVKLQAVRHVASPRVLMLINSLLVDPALFIAFTANM